MSASRFAKALFALLLLMVTTAQTLAPGTEILVPGIRYPKGQEIVRYERFDLLPENFQKTIKSTGCKIRDGVLKDSQIQLFRPTGSNIRLMVLVTCEAIVHHSFLFQMRSHRAIDVVSFSAPNWPMGFRSVKSPGYMEWHPETQTLTAFVGSDLCPSQAARYSYRLQGNQDDWVLFKIETVPDRCGVSGISDIDWKTYWEAPVWPSDPASKGRP